jgi:hypothetical protein
MTERRFAPMKLAPQAARGCLRRTALTRRRGHAAA